MKWDLIPRRGLRTGGTDIVVGTPRANVRAAMARHLPAPDSPRSPDEDQYYHSDGTTLFLRYDTADTLSEIMLIEGELTADGIELADTTWAELAPALEGRGFSITRAEHFQEGHDCPELGINITTREELGGDGDQIEWVAIWRRE